MYNLKNLKEDEQIIDKLRALPSLKYFKEKDMKGLLDLGRMIKYAPGEVIIQEGQFDNWVYFIVSGNVRIEKDGEMIGELKRRGDIFGEMGIIDGSPRSATIRAIDETVCVSFDISYMDRISMADKDAFNSILYQVFAQALAIRLRQADEALVSAMEENASLKAKLAGMTRG